MIFHLLRVLRSTADLHLEDLQLWIWILAVVLDYLFLCLLIRYWLSMGIRREAHMPLGRFSI